MTPDVVVSSYIDALNAADVDAVVACVAADFHSEHTAELGQDVCGRAVYRQRLADFLATFAGLRYEPEAMIVDGMRVAVPYRMTAQVVVGERARPIDLRGCFVFRIGEDGAIAHRLDYWDSAVYRRQVA